MVIAILPKQSGVSARTGNAWASQDFVIEVPAQYPRKCCFKIFGEDRINQFNIQGGETVTVHFDIDAHEYNGRWFNEVRCYNVIRGQQQTSAPQPQPQSAPPQQQNMFQNQPSAPFPPQQPEGKADDLPF